MDIQSTLQESIIKFLWSPEFKCNFIILISSLFLYQAPEYLVTMNTVAHSHSQFTADHRGISSPRSLSTFPHLFILAVVQVLGRQAGFYKCGPEDQGGLRSAYGSCLLTPQHLKLQSLSCYTRGAMNISSELLSATNLLY